MARSQIDWTQAVAADAIADVDNGAPLTMVAGVHPGCYELIAHDYVRSIAGLKGQDSCLVARLCIAQVTGKPHGQVCWS